MTPSERVELEACLKRASYILYNNSDSDKLETFEGIEQTVREQVLEYVSPEIALFLSKRKIEILDWYHLMENLHTTEAKKNQIE